MAFDLSKCVPLIINKSEELFSGPDIYSMKAYKRGYGVIIDNLNFTIPSPRRGSRADAIRLHSILEQIGFHVIHARDLTETEMNAAFDYIVKNPALSSHDCFIAIILSHGTEGGIICAKDFDRQRGFVTDMRIINKFSDSNCPALKGKPKLFFLSCCRGGKSDKPEADDLNLSQNDLSDIFVGYGTREGYVGWRHADLGSFFGIAIADTLIKHACDMELNGIFDKIKKLCRDNSKHVIEESDVQIEVAQNPECKKYKFDKKFYFNPGKCENISNNGNFENYTVKEIKLETANQEEFLKAQKTSSILQHLSDERVVQYFGVWFKNNLIGNRFEGLTLCIQMESCDKSLRDIMDEMIKDSNLIVSNNKINYLTSLGYYFASQIFIEALEGVNYLHKHNPQIIHRDLKPENIMLKLGSNNRFVKIDFCLVPGIAVHERDDQSHTRITGSTSNCNYVAPEVLKSREYDTRADVYSLGVIMQELFKIDINNYLTIDKSNSYLLTKKYRKLNDLCCGMISQRYRDRPDCEGILGQKELWALSSQEFRTLNEFEKVLTYNNSFIYSIVKLKLNQ